MDNDVKITMIIGASLGISSYLYMSSSIPVDSLCLLVVENGDDRDVKILEGETISKAHELALNHLKNLEETNVGYERATVTYDGFVTREDGIKRDALITQFFTMDSYANRRFVLLFSRDSEGQFNFEEKPYSLGEWGDDAPDEDLVIKVLLHEMEAANGSD